MPHKNREERLVYMQAWRDRNRHLVKQYSDRQRVKPDYRAKKRAEQIKRAYGMTIDQAAALLAKQNGQCAICDASISLLKQEGRRKAYLDHCHVNLTFRGFLCPSCNTALGFFDDSAVMLARAITYLEKANDQENEIRIQSRK